MMMNMIAESVEKNLLFLQRYIENPKRVGSVIPSSRFLTNKMLKPVEWENAKTIVELGAGTGVFTDYIAKHCKEDCEFLIVEKDNIMRNRLSEQYPELSFASKAEELDKSLQQLALPKADYIISGLPFANFSPELRQQILKAVKQSLKQDGYFITFQYSLQMKNTLNQYFKEVQIGFTPFNFPPAFVYYCQL